MRLDDEIFIQTDIPCRFIIMAQSVLINDIHDDGLKFFVLFLVLSDDPFGAGSTTDDSPAVFDKYFGIIRQAWLSSVWSAQAGRSRPHL